MVPPVTVKIFTPPARVTTPASPPRIVGDAMAFVHYNNQGYSFRVATPEMILETMNVRRTDHYFAPPLLPVRHLSEEAVRSWAMNALSFGDLAKRAWHYSLPDTQRKGRKPGTFTWELTGGIENVNPDNDNSDLIVRFDQDRSSFVIGTPPNLLAQMDNDRIDFFEGTPWLYVRRLEERIIQAALAAMTLGDLRRLDSLGNMPEVIDALRKPHQ